MPGDLQGMDSPLAGYSDTLQFVLQFLHTEGFHGAEDVLMRELEQRLPALLELEKGSPASSDRFAEQAEIFSPQSAPGDREVLDGDINYLGSMVKETMGRRSQSVGATTGTKSNLSEQGAEMQGMADGGASMISGSGSINNTWQQESSNADSQLPLAKTYTSARSHYNPLLGSEDEYSDEEDVGYVRIDVNDQEAFIASEIEEPGGSTGVVDISGSDDGKSTDSESETDRKDSETFGNLKRCGSEAGGRRTDMDEIDNLSAASETSSGSSRNSSYFSGELSPAMSALTSSADPAEFGLGSNIEFEVARLQIAQGPPLPPADAEQEIFVMGLSADPEVQKRVQLTTQEHIDTQASATQETNIAFASSLAVRTPAAENSSEEATLSALEVSQDNTASGDVVGATRKTNARAGGGNGLDFAFPVTPSAEDPAVVFSTWSNLRSRSVSNASDYSGHDFLAASGSSPFQGSPERGFSGNVEHVPKEHKDLKDESDEVSDKTEMRSPLLTALCGMSATEQDRWQGQPEAEQVLEVLSALEQPDSNQTRFGSYGSMHAQESALDSGSPPVSQRDPGGGSAGRQTTAVLDSEDEDESSEHDNIPAEEQFEMDDAAPDVQEAVTGSESVIQEIADSEGGVHGISTVEEEQKNDMVVMQYDAEEVNRKYEVFSLQIVHRRGHTGFEETKDFPIRLNDCIAGRYQVLDFLGSAAFSRAVQALDLKTGMLVCLKIIKNNKDYFDQSLDEIKLLKYVNDADPDDAAGVLRLFDYFYYKEHLFIVCELLRANLYEFQKYNRESGDEPYFTLPRLQAIARQVLQSLAYLHSLNLIHSDLKPENILIKSYSRCEVKVIDLGSSCFTTDHLSSYVQSRSYRAPEVILGLPYDQRIDVWSLGCILAELASGYVLFQNDSLATLLARLVGILGPLPKRMLRTGRYAHRFFTKSGHPYERSQTTGDYQILRPKATTLAARVQQTDSAFLEFLRHLLAVDPAERPTAENALQHPWLQQEYLQHHPTGQPL